MLIKVIILFVLGCLHVTTSYKVGVGRSDCTGPPVEIVFMGYAELNQRGKGLHLRQFSRAFIIDDGENRVVFVSVDACMISDSVKREVIRRLQLKFGNTYRIDNVAISGSHTHGTPGGFNEYTLYDAPTFGFVHETQRALISGIVGSIVKAHNNVQDARIFIDETEILDANINRSPTAYLNNPAEERAKYQYNTDKMMTQLRFVGVSNELIGVINWYAVHATSMNNTNKLISTDNLGYASILLEKEMDPHSLAGHGKIVTAFASSNLGDSSPNTKGPYCQHSGMPCDILTSRCQASEGPCVATGPGKDDTDSCRIIATTLFNGALKLLMKNSGDEITGNINYIHQFIDMPNSTTTYVNTTTNQEETVHGCIPAMGYSFAAGTTDGPGLVEFFQQGTTTDNPFWNLVRTFLAPPTLEDVRCHAPKPILLATGRAAFPYPWQPRIVPTQLLKIGQLIIAAVPGEFTTMSGRRLRNSIATLAQQIYQNSNVKVILAGLTNSYSSYITTPEEYQIQRYEGASTIFGPYTLPIYISQYRRLYEAMSQNIEIGSGPSPPVFDNRLISLTTPVIFDGSPLGKSFGQVTKQPKAQYNRGQQVSVQFISSNPRNNLQHGNSYFYIEKYSSDNNWVIVANDADWDTKMQWERTSVMLGQSILNVFWNISETTEPGTYRISNRGTMKPILGSDRNYTGETEIFSVQ